MSRQYLIYLPIEFHAVLAHLKPYLVMTLCPENAVPLQPRPAFNGPPRPISTLNEVYYNLTTARTGGRATCGRIYSHRQRHVVGYTVRRHLRLQPHQPHHCLTSTTRRSWLENAIPQTNLDYWYVNRRNPSMQNFISAKARGARL